MIRFLPLKKVCKQIVDCPHESPEWLREGITVIRNFNLVDGQLDLSDRYCVDEETYEKRIKRAVPSDGDIIFSREAPIGNCAIIPPNTKCCLGQRLVLLRVDTDVCSSEYLLAALQSQYVKQQIEQVSKSGSIVSNFNISDLKELIIPVVSQQETVSNISATLNRKVRTNKEIIDSLEAVAKTLYDYWFVQFDFPDENGNPYRTSGGEMEWNEQLKREIPKGWEAKNIQEICAVVDCLHSKKPDLSFEAENYYLLQLDNLVDMGLLDLSNKYYVSANDYAAWTSKIEVRCGDLVITNAGRVGDIARIPEGIICGIGRNMTAIRAVNVDPIFMYYFFASSDMKAQIKSNTDTGSFFGSLNVRGIKQLIMPIPSKESEIMNRFIDIVRPIRENLEMVAQQSQELLKLRDWLLPMLMNGQARVE